MSKELTPLETLEKLVNYILLDEKQGYMDKDEADLVRQDKAIIEQALKRLAKIDDLFEEIGIDENDLCVWFELQKQDGKKVNAFEIIKNKKVDVEWLLNTICRETYNDDLHIALTQEEYDVLKRSLL